MNRLGVLAAVAVSFALPYKASAQTVGYLTNIAALEALSSAATASYGVQGYSIAADGGGGTFVYNPNDTTSADNHCTIFTDAGGDRWYRVYSGAVNVKWCGAQGTACSSGACVDDTTAIGYALSSSYNVYVPATA